MSDSSSAPSGAWTPDGLRFVLVTMVLLLVANVVNSILGGGWKVLTATLALMIALMIGRIVRHHDRALLGWLVFGVFAGFAELVADWWLVGTGTLIYPQDEPMIWVSPAYMPFAWAVVLAQIGYISGWIRSKFAALKAALLTGLLAGVNIPLYEHLANDAKLWHYVDTPMIFDAPYYVILAEFLLALPLALWVGWIVRGRLVRNGVLLGAAEGVVMLIAVMIAFWLVGPCDGAVIQLPCR